MYFYEHVIVSMNTLILLKVPYFKTNQGWDYQAVSFKVTRRWTFFAQTV